MSVGSQIRRIAALDVPVQAMREMFLVLAEQLELEEGKRAASAERQKRYRQRHNNGDSDATVTQQSHNDDVTVTPLAPVKNKPLSSLPTEKEEEKGNLSVSQKDPPSKPLSSEDDDVSRDAFKAQAEALSQGFDRFWEIYPKRAGTRDKPGAFKGFRAALKRASLETILAGAQRYANHIERSDKAGTEFILQARTWLNKQCWTEDYTDARPRNGKTSRADAFAILDAVTDEALRREGRRPDSDEADFIELSGLRQSAA